jgi:hypothetical protein
MKEEAIKVLDLITLDLNKKTLYNKVNKQLGAGKRAIKMFSRRD